MKIILAPDSYKGSLTSAEASAAMSRGILRVIPSANLISIPMADGGEGTVSAVLSAVKGIEITVAVHGPMGSLTNAVYGILEEDGSAIIEMAAASGLTLIPLLDRNPMEASTFGTGELIRSALDHGCRKIYIGIGGSATNDGGVGMAEALGVRFYDSENHRLPGNGRSLEQMERMDLSGLDPRIKETEFIVLCDVRNPLCGPNGASYIFGTQKGATQEQVKILDKGLCNYATKFQECTGISIMDVPGAGAAGGLGAGLMAFCDAKLLTGCDAILEMSGFDHLLDDADLVITGEGRIDQSTEFGKVPYRVGAFAKKHGVPVVAIGGSVSQSSPGKEESFFITESAVTDIISLEEAIEHAAVSLETAAERVMRLISLGMNLRSQR
jgi:glycerate kinase